MIAATSARIFRGLLQAIIRRPFLWLFVVLAGSTGLGIYGAQQQIKGDLEDLFPDHTPAVVRAREARRILGSKTELQILVGSPDRELNLRAAGEMAAFLEKRSEEIDRVEFKRDIAFFEKNALLFVPLEDVAELQTKVSTAIQKGVKKDLGLDDFDDDEPATKPEDDKPDGDKPDDEGTLPSVDELKAKYKVEGFSEYFDSPDGQVIAVKAFPKFKPSDSSKTGKLAGAIEVEFERLRQANPGLQLAMEGDYSELTQSTKQITRDAGRSLMWAGLLIGILTILYFRRVRAIVLIIVPLAVSLVWALAFARFFVGYLNLVTSVLLGILMGLGIDFLIHAIARVEERFNHDTTFEQALVHGLMDVGRAMWDAASTTAVTLFALIIFDFRGFSQFGLIAGMGVLFSMLAVYVAYPPVALVMHRVWKQKPGAQHDGKPRFTFARPPGRRMGLVLVLTIVAVALGAATFVPDIHYEADMGKLRAKTVASVGELKKKYRAEVDSKTASPALIITDDIEQTGRLARYMKANLAQWPVLKDVSSIYTFVPEQQDEKLAIVKEIKRKITNKYEALDAKAKAEADKLMAYLDPAPFGPTELPPWVREKFTDTEGGFGRYVLLYANGSKANAKVVIGIQDQIGEVTLPGDGVHPDKTYFSSASFYINAAVYNVVKEEGPRAVLLALAIVILLVILDFRKLRPTIQVLVPLFSGFAIFLGILALADIPVNVFNIVVFPQIFGIGVDTGIHLVHRWREAPAARGREFWTGFLKTASASGMCSITTAVGFGSLIACENEGLQSIGWVAFIGVMTLYLTNLLMITGFILLMRDTPTTPAASAVATA